MKKYIILFLMLVYGLSSTGASLHLHFCCGKLDDVSFSIKHKEGCSGEAPDNKTCCNNVDVDLKIDADQQPATKLIPVLNLATAIVPVYYSWQATLPAKDVYASNNPHGPPDDASPIPVYLKNRVFRI